MGTEVLVADEISFAYGARRVIDRVSLGLFRGESLGVVGPNGTGKSTLLKMLSGVLRPKSGRISLAVGDHGTTRNLSDLSRMALAQTVAVVPQSPSLPDNFTASEIVLLGRTPHLGLLQAERKRDWDAVWDAMQTTDTLSLAQRRVGELSGGERQRVVIARALAQEPSVLLLDEPTLHLDLSHQVTVLDLVSRLRRERGLAVLAVFHDLNLAAQYCDALLMLRNGRVFARGAPVEVISQDNVRSVYGTRVCVMPHPYNGLPMTVTMPALKEDGHGIAGGEYQRVI